MLFEGSSDIVKSRSPITLKNGDIADVITLFNDLAIVIGTNALAVYKEETCILDPLGNGVIDHKHLPAGISIKPSNQQFVSEYTAGFIGLSDDKALLITPSNIQLFPNKTDALHNRNEIVRLNLT